MKYFIRAVKYLVYFVLVFCIIVAILLLTSNKSEVSIGTMFAEGALLKIAIFFVVIAAVYPILGFQKKKIYINEDFSKYQSEIEQIFTNLDYTKEPEKKSGTITFIHSKATVRLSRMYEDRITIDYSDNPITIEGLRKDVFRIAKTIEYITLKERDENV